MGLEVLHDHVFIVGSPTAAAAAAATTTTQWKGRWWLYGKRKKNDERRASCWYCRVLQMDSNTNDDTVPWTIGDTIQYYTGASINPSCQYSESNIQNVEGVAACGVSQVESLLGQQECVQHDVRVMFFFDDESGLNITQITVLQEHDNTKWWRIWAVSSDTSSENVILLAHCTRMQGKWAFLHLDKFVTMRMHAST